MSGGQASPYSPSSSSYDQVVQLNTSSDTQWLKFKMRSKRFVRNLKELAHWQAFIPGAWLIGVAVIFQTLYTVPTSPSPGVVSLCHLSVPPSSKSSALLPTCQDCRMPLTQAGHPSCTAMKGNCILIILTMVTDKTYLWPNMSTVNTVVSLRALQIIGDSRLGPNWTWVISALSPLETLFCK